MASFSNILTQSPLQELPLLKIGTATDESGGIHTVFFHTTRLGHGHHEWTVRVMEDNRVIDPRDVDADKPEYNELLQFLAAKGSQSDQQAPVQCQSQPTRHTASVEYDNPRGPSDAMHQPSAVDSNVANTIRRGYGEDDCPRCHEADLVNGTFETDYKELAGDYGKIWDAYSKDTHSFDMQDDSICLTVRKAWENIKPRFRGRNAPPYEVLRNMMKEKREEDKSRTRQNRGLRSMEHYYFSRC